MVMWNIIQVVRNYIIAVPSLPLQSWEVETQLRIYWSLFQSCNSHCTPPTTSAI